MNPPCLIITTEIRTHAANIVNSPVRVHSFPPADIARRSSVIWRRGEKRSCEPRGGEEAHNKKCFQVPRSFCVYNNST